MKGSKTPAVKAKSIKRLPIKTVKDVEKSCVNICAYIHPSDVEHAKKTNSSVVLLSASYIG